MSIDMLLSSRFIFKILNRFVFKYPSLQVMKQVLVSKLVEKNKDWAFIDSVGIFENKEVRKNKTIWILWTQGIEQAPPLVQKCVASIKSRNKDYDVIVLNRDNLELYVKLPDHVERLYKTGKMGEALHSDMVRLYLLIHYGGVWCDATCYQSSNFPDYLNYSKFFMFSSDMLPVERPIVSSNWFIKSDFYNPLLVKTYNFLSQYHKCYETPHDYYIFHITLSTLTKIDEECKAIWENVPYVCNMNPHVFYFNWHRSFDLVMYQHYFNQCFIHKLSYKYTSEEINDKENMLNYFLQSE